MTLKWRCFDV